MDDMTITSAQYVQTDGVTVAIKAVIDGVTWSVSMQPGNRHYDEIQRQVAAGTLTIQDAD